MEKLVVNWEHKTIGGITKGCSGFRKQIETLRDTFNTSHKDFLYFEKIESGENTRPRYALRDNTLKVICNTLNVEHIE